MYARERQTKTAEELRNELYLGKITNTNHTRDLQLTSSADDDDSAVFLIVSADCPGRIQTRALKTMLTAGALGRGVRVVFVTNHFSFCYYAPRERPH